VDRRREEVSSRLALTSCVLAVLFVACSDKGSSDEQHAASAGAGPVDACAFMPAAQVEARVGELAGAAQSVTVEPPIVAMCRQRIAGDLQATLTLRSLTDWGAMGEGGSVLHGLGDDATLSHRGVMLKLAGRPYFFHVLVTGQSGVEQDKSVELAKIVVAAAGRP
jgi:hypothetical protein